MNKFKIAFILLIFPLGLQAKDVRLATAVPKSSGEFIRYIAGYPENLDPVYSVTSDYNQIIPELFEGLFSSDMSGNIAPRMAKSWQVLDQGRVIRFHLRDALWSDGSAVIAQNFVDAFRRVFDRSVNAGNKPDYLLQDIVNASQNRVNIEELGVHAIDDKTLEIQFNEPITYIKSLLLNPVFSPVPSHVIKVHGQQWTSLDNIVVNGAYLPVDKNSQTLVLKKNPKYWDVDKVFFDTVEFMRATSFQGRKLMLSGHADVMNAENSETIGSFNDFITSEPFQAIESSLSATVFLNLNVKHKGLDNVNVRRALSLGLDRSIIESHSRDLAYGFAADAKSIGWKRYKSDEFKRLSLAAREKLAIQMMAEAGYNSENRLELDILYSQGFRNKGLLRGIAHQWYKIGVNVVFTPVSSVTELFDRIGKQDFQVAWASWHADFDDPQNFLSILGVNEQFSITSWDNARFADLFKKLQREQKPKDRVKIISQMEHLIAQEVPLIPVFYGNRLVIGSEKIMFGKPNFLGVQKIMNMRLK